jgi:hypothetical protein
MSSKRELRSVLLSKFMSWIKPNHDLAQKEDSGVSYEQNAMLDGEITPDETKEIEPEDADHVVGPTSYLDDEPLSQEFEKKIDTPFTVHFCFYKIIDDLATPFLEFYMEKKDGVYGFPKTTITPQSVLEPIAEPEENTTDTDYHQHNADGLDMHELCSPFLMNYILAPESMTREPYKGFLEIDETNFVVVWNCTNLEFNLENQSGLFVILDEILHKEGLLGEPIDSKVGNLFREHEYMKFILDKDGHPVSIPICMYQVEKNGVDYENSVYEEGVNWKTEESGFDPQIDHPIFGNVYLFSTDLVETNSYQNVKRFVGFTQDVLYIMNKNFALEENLVANKEDFRDFTGVSFYENGAECMAFYTNGVFMEL